MTGSMGKSRRRSYRFSLFADHEMELVELDNNSKNQAWQSASQ